MKTVMALWQRNLKAFVRNRTSLVFSTIFPFFFLYIFNSIFSNEFVEDPVAYMLAGIIISTVFEISLRISSSTIDDMASGFMKEVLVSPVKRITIAAGQFLSSATIATAQALIIFIIGFFIGYRVESWLTIVYVILMMIFVGLVFAGFGLFLATKTKNTQTFQIVSMAISMPMMFISGAYIPLSMVPNTIQIIGRFNPMTYAVAAFRWVALERTHLGTQELINEELAFTIGNFTVTPMISLVILLGFGVLFLALSTISFTRTDFSKLNRSKADSIEW